MTTKRLGIDLHGVIDTDVSKFKWILRLIVLQGKMIHIVSGPPAEEIKAELDGYGFKEGFHYCQIHSVVDHLKEKDVTMWLDHKNTWWASDEDWWSSKAKICKEFGIEEMIDDKRRYSKYFKDTGIKFILYSPNGEMLLQGM